jgi:hypothetical protein
MRDVKIMYITYLAVILVGVVYVTALGLMHR